jgi:hypothetical protein
VAVGDFNGDGIPDLAVADYGQAKLTILQGNGDGTFTALATSPATGTDPSSVAVGDFNGDGIPDVAAANYASYTVTALLSGTATTATASVSGISPPGTHRLHAERGRQLPRRQ